MNNFVLDGLPISVEIGRMEFLVHSPETATVPAVKFRVVVVKTGALFATAYCNIHGLWSSSAKIEVAWWEHNHEIYENGII